MHLPLVGRQPLWLVAASTGLVGVTFGYVAATLTTVAAAPTFAGMDFHVFYAAGLVVRHGGDPYQFAALSSAMARWTGVPPANLIMRFVYAPWFGIIMAPLSILPYVPCVILWTALGFAAVVLPMTKWASTLGWPHSSAIAIAAGICGVAMTNYYVGQVATFELALLIAVLISVIKGRFAAAAALAVVAALLKPQDLWPLVPLVWLAAATIGKLPRGRMLTSQIATAALLLGLPLFVNAALIPDWLRATAAFAQNLRGQPGLAGLPGMLNFLPNRLHIYPNLNDPLVAGIAAAGCATAILWLWHGFHHGGFPRLSEPRRVAWVLLIPSATWLLVTPYGHTQDLITLLPLVVVAAWSPYLRGHAISTLALVIGIAWVPLAWWTFGSLLFSQLSFAPLATLIVVSISVHRCRQELRAAEASEFERARAPGGRARCGPTAVP